MPSQSRRFTLKVLAAAGAWLGLARTFKGQTEKTDTAGDAAAGTNKTTISWSDCFDRTFLSGDCWANPMENWSVVDGAAECSSRGRFRNIQLLTHQLTDAQAQFKMSVTLSQVQSGPNDGGAGFQLGIRSALNDHRSNAFASNGIRAGIAGGKLVIGGSTTEIKGLANPQDVTLTLAGTPHGKRCNLTLTATSSDGIELNRVTHDVPAAALLGNVALVNNFANAKSGGKKKGAGQGGRYRFNDWSVSGEAFSVNPDHRFGPLLWSMYSLSDSRGDDGFVMKLMALTAPMGNQDSHDVELLIEKNGQWKSLGKAALDPDAWVANFRIPNWDEKTATPYKVVYQQKHPSGQQTESIWEGTIQANPSGRPLRLAAMTCQKDYGFPYAPVAENIINLKPDMLYFSGDQIYEEHGGYGLIREPADRAILNYLRKYYMHGWAFRHAMKNAPTICLPDDHDVFHGNIWGESGAAMAATAASNTSRVASEG